MVIFIPNIARCSKIVLIFTLNFCDNFSLSTLIVSWIYILVDLTEHSQFQGTGPYWKDVLNLLSFFDLLLLLLSFWMCPDISDLKKSFSTFMPSLFVEKNIPSTEIKNKYQLNLKKMEVSIQQIIFISNLLKFPLMWYSQ